jgi:hypothetical protein
MILDFIMDCSALMEQVDSLIQSGDPTVQDDYQKGEQLLSGCLSLKDQLDLGFSEMQTRLGFPWSFTQQKPFWSELDDSIPRDLSLVPNPIYCGGQPLYFFTHLSTTYSISSFGHETTSHLRCGIFRLPTISLPRVPQ